MPIYIVSQYLNFAKCYSLLSREAAVELTETVNEDKSRVASEMADLLYHCMVFLCSQGVKMEDVLEVHRKRFSQYGIEEKSSHKPKGQSC